MSHWILTSYITEILELISYAKQRELRSYPRKYVNFEVNAPDDIGNRSHNRADLPAHDADSEFLMERLKELWTDF